MLCCSFCWIQSTYITSADNLSLYIGESVAKILGLHLDISWNFLMGSWQAAYVFSCCS
ncbi:C2H2-type domain-containing protein [Psidium guajava]|nr:C2H2-type domain-containing protein [Psidium guajava]